jgi:hypothetical protein
MTDSSTAARVPPRGMKPPRMRSPLAFIRIVMTVTGRHDTFAVPSKPYGHAHDTRADIA